MNKIALITGVNGFIGRHCIPFLLNSFDEVHGMGRSPSCVSKEISYHQCDFLDPNSVESLIKKVQPSHVLHLAWETEHGQYWESHKNIDWLKASMRFFQLLDKNKLERVVCSGTCAEYDWSNQGYYSENSLVYPSTLYGLSKASLFSFASSFFSEIGVSFGWGRIFFVYGPYEGQNRLIPAIAKCLVSNQKVALSACEQIRDFTHVRDVSKGLSILLKSNHQGAFNISSGEGTKLKTIALKLGSLTNAQHLLDFNALEARPNEPEVIVGLNSKLKTELCFEPEIELVNGLQDILSWWEHRE